jgi:hypothetical protein
MLQEQTCEFQLPHQKGGIWQEAGKTPPFPEIKKNYFARTVPGGKIRHRPGHGPMAGAMPSV